MNALNPWQAAQEIAQVFGVNSEVLKEGARWSKRWAGVTKDAERQSNKVLAIIDTGISGTSKAAALLAKQQANYEKNRHNLARLQAAQARLTAFNSRNSATSITQQKAKLTALRQQVNTRAATMTPQQRQTTVAVVNAVQQELSAQEAAERRLRVELMARDREMKEALVEAKKQQEIQEKQAIVDKKLTERIAALNNNAVLTQGGMGQVSKPARFGFGGAIVSLTRTNPYIGKLPNFSEAKYKKIESIMRQMVRFAKRQSSGPYSLKQLAAMDHPYAKRHPFFNANGKLKRIKPVPGTVTRDVINSQTGDLKNAWSGKVDTKPDGMEMDLMNTAPYAQYLAEGTETMISHGPWTAAFKQFMPQIDEAWAQVALGAQREYMMEQARAAAATSGKRKVKSIGGNFS